MSTPDTALFNFIKEDYGITGNGRWWRSVEHSSLVYDAERDIYFFNAEDNSGDAYIYLIKVRKLSSSSARELLKQHVFTGTFIHEVKNGQEVITYPKLVDVFNEALNYADKSYFYRRTITDETIARFKLGYYAGFYTIPIYMDGVFKQFQLRRDDPKTIKNYYKGVGAVLFNSDIMKITDKIFITEGVTSCIVMSQNGIPCVSYNSGATGFVSEWLKYFVHQKQIYLLYDFDQAGKQGAVKTAKILGENKCKIYTFDSFDTPGYDANDYFIDGGDKDGLLELVYKDSKYCFELEEYDKRNRFNTRKSSFSRR